ncbi:bifunctional diaminohydroxyphosphoribosylaminopyrimidine deaminase/5-amino-6-(5-phosphoribosylamino)uracil reductase RibD [Tateyamaria sp.]|uniref:bifunctional diaminohydroxyphosphoribosylaminopyrimidine deaminase/5-amino-6-(5-phosphoribosylamino)uracil reductase RibD n=2 Tax=Tateyamaria sp. TaxID=1929288 RepID=UPI0032DCA5B9
MSPTRPNSDLSFMMRALDLARGARGHVWPNPPVGCVVVRDGMIIAEAATHPGGRPHAERKALEMAGEGARGSTLYVTLEPCCHWGKTPPCADAIIAAGISRAVCAIQDPDPRVDGGGFDRLRGAGVDLTIGLGADEASAVMSGFFHRVRTGIPELVIGDVDFGIIPDGVDAVLRTSQIGLILQTRTRMQNCKQKSTDAVMRWMGAIGLTTVAVPRDDPFVQELHASSGMALARMPSNSPQPPLGAEV